MADNAPLADDAAAAQEAAAVKIQARVRGMEARAEDKKKKKKKGKGKKGKGKKKGKKKKKKKKRIGIFLIGASGAGKSAQAAMLREVYECPVLTPPGVVEWAVQTSTAAGVEIKTMLEAAEGGGSSKAPDETIVAAFLERLLEPDVRDANAFVADGFPPNAVQAAALLSNAPKKWNLHLVNLVCDADTRLVRVNGRVLDPQTGKRFNRNFDEMLPPADPEIAERLTTERDDDPTLEADGLASRDIEYTEGLEDVKSKWTNAESDDFTTAAGDVDASAEAAEETLMAIRKLVGPSAREEEAAAKIQAQVRGTETRRELKRREEAAVQIQARIRGAETRTHHRERIELVESHEEHELMNRLIDVASGPYLTKLQKCFPRKDKDDMTVVALIDKIKGIKKKDDAIKALKTEISKPMAFRALRRIYPRQNSKGEHVLCYSDFEASMDEHGTKMPERQLELQEKRQSMVLKEYELRSHHFKELFDSLDRSGTGTISMDDFHEAFKEKTVLWGYADALATDDTREIALFKAIDVDDSGGISWEEFKNYMDSHTDKQKQEVADQMAVVHEKARAADRVKEQQVAAEMAAAMEEEYETDDEAEAEVARASGRRYGSENVRRRVRDRAEVIVTDGAAQAHLSRLPNSGGRLHPEDDAPPSLEPGRKAMLVKVLRKYRRGLHRMFTFYSRANIGAVKQHTFDQLMEEHSGVNLLMFRRMCKDFNLILDKRARFNPRKKKDDQLLRPYVSAEEIDAIFRRHAQHLKRVSSVSHGKGILNQAQFAAALAQVAVVLLRGDPWSERYPEEWRRVDAIFSRLDMNNYTELHKRMRGYGGFSSGDGDIGARDGSSPTLAPNKGFSFNLRLPGDPVTPPPAALRPKRTKQAMAMRAQGQGQSPGARVPPAVSERERAEEENMKMTMSLAADFGIDDSSGTAYGGNPYGTTSGASYGDVSSMLDNLGLTYGLDGGDLGKRRGGSLGRGNQGDWANMQSMSWNDLDDPSAKDQTADAGLGPNLMRSPPDARGSRMPRRPQQPKGARMRQQQSPRMRKARANM